LQGLRRIEFTSWQPRPPQLPTYQTRIARCFENLMICRRTESNDILLELVAKTLAVGAYEMQVEYEDRKEHVFAFQEGVGFGIASLDASSEEAQALREALYQIRRKQKIVTIEGVEYRLRARIHQSFGEDVFRVTIKKG
jgi:hypothetical protein